MRVHGNLAFAGRPLRGAEAASIMVFQRSLFDIAYA
jgi:hypothetical protein